MSPLPCKKSIPCIQALHFNRICFKNNFFDIYCNNLEKWLCQRGYSEKLVRKEILKARSQLTESLLNKGEMCIFWAHKLDTFYPNSLNQREIYAALSWASFDYGDKRKRYVSLLVD